jgi:manganese/iron transport system permease protein
VSELVLEPFRLPYMQRALTEVLLLGVLTGVAGVFVVLRRLAFMTDALTHTVFPGLVVAHLAGRSLALGALAFGVLTAVLFTLLAANRRVGSDAGMAIVLTALFSVGVVLVSRQHSYASDLTLFLFGRVLTVDRGDLVTTLVLAVLVLAVLAVLGKELVLRAFDPEGSTAMGYPGVLLDLVLNLLIALVVVAAVKAVGTVLVVAMLVVPAASARLLSDRLARMTVLSCAFGVLGGWGGLLASYQLSVRGGVRLAAGATIVVVLVACFLAALAVAALRDRAGRGTPSGMAPVPAPAAAAGGPGPAHRGEGASAP